MRTVPLPPDLRCYVCKQKRNGLEPVVRISSTMWYHAEKCAPGSRRWMKSATGKRSPLYHCFAAQANKRKSKKEKA